MTKMNGNALQLCEFGVATVYEASGRNGYIDIPLTSIIPGSVVSGPVRIASCGQGDNRAVHEVMARVEPGDVLLLRMPRPEPIALLGELLATQAKVQGAIGVLVDAAVRDVTQIKSLGLPVWARYIRVIGANKNIRGEIDVPVTVGGILVSPGDFLVLDDDGAVVVPKGKVSKTIEASGKRVGKEGDLLAKYREGLISYDLYGMRSQDEGDLGDSDN